MRLNAASDNLWFTLLFERTELFLCDNNLGEMSYGCDLFLKVMVHEHDLTPEARHFLSRLATENRLQPSKEWLKLRLDTMQLNLERQKPRLAEGRLVDVNSPSDSLGDWSRVHQRVRRYADDLRGRFLWFDFDSFCLEPEKQAPELLGFVGVSGRDVVLQCLGVEPPGSAGRFRDRDLSVFRDERLLFVQEMGFSIN